jgi:protease-4
MNEEISKNKKKGGGLLFLIIVIVIVVLAAVFGILKGVGVIKGAPSASRGNNPINLNLGNFKLGKFGGSKYIARLYITGVIQEANETYNQKWLLDTGESLEADANNAGILLVIDSPGGTVYEADELYLALRKYKNSGKEVWAYFKSMAASGAYYIACSADTIYANRNTVTGSIGVIYGPTIDATGLLEKIGVKSTNFVSGKNKAMGHYDTPMTDEQRKIMQSLVDECYDQFASIVASARKKSLTETKALADGRVYTASQAKSNGLIDGIGSQENAEDRMRERLMATQGLSGEEADAVDFVDYEYIYQAPFMRRIFESMTGVSVKRVVDEKLGPSIKYPAYLFVY